MGAEELSLQIGAATGAVKGSFIHPELGLRELHGVVDQELNRIVGQFEGATLPGTFQVENAD